MTKPYFRSPIGLISTILLLTFASYVHAQADLNELESDFDAQIEAELEAKKPAPEVEKPRVISKVISEPASCPQQECLCKCLKNSTNVNATALKPSFKGFVVGSACVCPCLIPKPTAAELMRRNPFAPVRAR
jgi:hypothetical protein